MANWEARYDRRQREWGTYSARPLAYLVNCPTSPDHASREMLPAGFYVGAGDRDRRYADAWAAELNASAAYVALGEG